MKIVGIVPSTDSPYLRFGIFRLGLPILVTKARQVGHRAVVVDENIEKINSGWLKNELATADLVIFSAMTPTYEQTRRYNRWIKKDLGLMTPTAIGGVHPTFEYEKVLNDGFDFVFRGEGELVFPEFLEVFENSGDFSKIPNLCYWRDGEKIFNPLSLKLPDLDKDSPFPIFSDKNTFPQWNKNRMGIIETSRSCPHHCTFCSVHPMFGPVRQRENLEAVVEEMERLNPGFVFFCDDCFACYKNTERSKKLMELMLRKMRKIPPWGAQVRSDVARDPEWLMLAKRSGCFFLCIGFESINPNSLKEAHKGQTQESIEKDIGSFKEYGLEGVIHGSFVIGFDTDDKNTAIQTAKWAKKRMNSFQIGILTPLPGTELREKLKNEGRLLPEIENPELCDGLHVLYAHPKMTREEFQKSVAKAGMKFSPFWENIRLSVEGAFGWLKDWALSSKNREMLINNFRKPFVRWRSWAVYKKIRKRANLH